MILFLTKTIFSLFAGYPYGGTLGSVVGSTVTGGAAGCYGYWLHTTVAQDILFQAGWRHTRRLH
jgi:hypothetical protein